MTTLHWALAAMHYAEPMLPAAFAAVIMAGVFGPIIAMMREGPPE